VNNNRLVKYMDKKYWKETQRLNLKTCIEKEEGSYYSQEISIGDYYLCEIITFDCLDASDIGNVPYCMKASWGEFNITVQRFGELTDEDIHKAIGFCLKQLDHFGFWNVTLDGELIDARNWHLYTWSTDAIRMWNDMLKRKNERSKQESKSKSKKTNKRNKKQ